METPKDLREITDSDWEDMEQAYSKYDPGNKGSWYRDLWFDITWNYDHYIRSNYRNTINGFSNLWRWRKIIWRDRFWDYQFLIDTIEFKLKDMEENWVKNTWGCGDKKIKKELQGLLMILEEIDHLDNDYDIGWKERDQKIDLCYQDFGRKLFDIREIEQENCEGSVERTYKTSFVRTLWD